MSIIKTNITKAKEIHKENIREARISKLAEQDIEFQKALETGSSTTDAVCAIAFGGDKTASNGTFKIEFPTNDATAAIIRLA